MKMASALDLIVLCPIAFALCVLISTASTAGAELLGVQTMPEDSPYVLDDAPLTLLLSKGKYPAEDLHLDAIVWLQAPEGDELEGRLQVSLHDDEGTTVSSDTIAPVSGPRMFFSVPFPATMAGGNGSLRVAWLVGDREIGRAEDGFAVLPESDPPTSGRIRLYIPNDRAASMSGVPVTVGVPFPRGAIHDDRHIRLLDADGQELPLQTKVTSRWSRFGSIRWLQCDFAADVADGPSEVFLEYGPDVNRQHNGGIRVQQRDDAPPLIEAGQIRFGDGIEFDPGDGFRQIVKPESLDGAFVEHEDGRRFVVPSDTEWEIEEQGPEKVRLRRRGWYVLPGTEERFCKFDTRFDIYRGTPVVRMYHTWIFTGYPYEDLYRWESGREMELIEGAGDADRVRDMGWRFGLEDGLAGEGFLLSYDTPLEWCSGDYLLQYDYDKSEVAEDGEVTTKGGRAAGVASATGNGVRLQLGVKDFWQNFPNELEFTDEALFFHQWPRHGKPRTHPVDIETGLRLWFAHEGRVLDFALPEEWVTNEDFFNAAPGPDSRRYAYSQRGRRQSVNAQGVAKTDEFWLVFSEDTKSADESAKLLRGLNDNTLRAMVDPEWVADSGAFYEMHEKDEENFPNAERVYDLHAHAPMTWIDRMGFYGKWVWGDMTWRPDPEEGSFGLYRGFRKSHQGWPYSWIPFARSGEPELMRMADAATRHQADVNFCHYSDSRVPGKGLAEGEPRPRGFYIRFRIPWAAHVANANSRGYIDKCDYLWDSYYLTGYPRARDVALDWGYLTKHEGANCWGDPHNDLMYFRAPLKGHDPQRGSSTLLQTYVQMYQATFDPWYLAAAHQIAQVHLEMWREYGWEGHTKPGEPTGAAGSTAFNSGPREFHRFTGCEEYDDFYRHYARSISQLHKCSAYRTWAWRIGMIEPTAYAYLLTEDEYYLSQVAFWLDYADIATYEGPVESMHGWLNGPMFTGYFLQYFPFALTALERGGWQPGPQSAESGFLQLCPDDSQPARDGMQRYHYRIALHKDEDAPIPLILRANKVHRFGNDGHEEDREPFRYRVEGPDGDTVLEGKWDLQEHKTVEISAHEPNGVYRVHVDGFSSSETRESWSRSPMLALPVSSFGTPEVLELEPGAAIDRSWPTSQYWFMVPEGVEEFWVEFLGDPPSRRLSVWGPDGRRAWDRQFTPNQVRNRDVESLRAVVHVPEDQAGRLWRVTTSHNNTGIALDPAIPRIFATSHDRWFQP